MLIELESVGCVFDTEKQTVHTMFFLGGYDKENGFDVDKCEDDFYGNLSEQDIDLIKENCKFDIDKKINKIKLIYLIQCRILTYYIKIKPYDFLFSI